MTAEKILEALSHMRGFSMVRLADGSLMITARGQTFNCTGVGFADSINEAFLWLGSIPEKTECPKCAERDLYAQKAAASLQSGYPDDHISEVHK